MTQQTIESTQQFAGAPEPEDALGGLTLKGGLSGDPAVLGWLASVKERGRAW